MKEHENIDVLCIECKQRFVTSRESFDVGAASCPSCGEKKLQEKRTCDG